MTDVSRETRLSNYLALIERWGGTLNLTSRTDRSRDRLDVHLRESIAVAPFVPLGATRLIDLGSGQGFPAIPLAITCNLDLDLIEADRRKAAFLTSALAQLGIAGRVWPDRIETCAVPPASLVTARALAELPRLLDWSKPLLLDGGTGLFLKGSAARDEIAAAYTRHSFDAEIIDLPGAASCLVKITALG